MRGLWEKREELVSVLREQGIPPDYIDVRINGRTKLHNLLKYDLDLVGYRKVPTFASYGAINRLPALRVFRDLAIIIPLSQYLDLSPKPVASVTNYSSDKFLKKTEFRRVCLGNNQLGDSAFFAIHQLRTREDLQWWEKLDEALNIVETGIKTNPGSFTFFYNSALFEHATNEEVRKNGIPVIDVEKYAVSLS